MLILLPPSEKKKAATGDHNFELSDLAFATELLAARSSALVNQEILPTAEAIEIYDGVLYQGLNWKDLSDADRKRANSRVLIISALFGLVRPTDQIFKYKLKIDNSLWRESIAQVAANLTDELIIDCRSSTYKGVWPVNPERTIEVRVFKISDGVRSVITHMSKKYRGELTRHLLLQPSDPRNPAELQQIAAELFECELHPPIDGQPWTLDLLIS
jgi:cytoplasmic iron level regulating protein YaaA (DUF328/UPF0246 family)